jgi:small subunit ribosomal protein S13
MLYFINTRVKSNPHLEDSLQAIFGVGKATSKLLFKVRGLLRNIRGKELRKKHKIDIKIELEGCSKPISRDLIQIYKANCQRLVNNNSYRGIRHKFGYPVRGQRTRTNASLQKKLNKRWLKQPYRSKSVFPIKRIVKRK